MLKQNKSEFSKGQYQTAYHLLFNRITDALAEEELSVVRGILTEAQQRAEEIFLEELNLFADLSEKCAADPFDA